MEQEADLENWARLNGYWHDDPHAYFKELGYIIIDAYYRFNSPGLGLGGKFIFG